LGHNLLPSHAIYLNFSPILSSYSNEIKCDFTHNMFICATIKHIRTLFNLFRLKLSIFNNSVSIPNSRLLSLYLQQFYFLKVRFFIALLFYFIIVFSIFLYHKFSYFVIQLIYPISVKICQSILYTHITGSYIYIYIHIYIHTVYIK